MLKLIYRFSLGIAAREGGHLSPEAAIWVFMNDNGVILHVSILSQAADGFDSEIAPPSR